MNSKRLSLATRLSQLDLSVLENMIRERDPVAETHWQQQLPALQALRTPSIYLKLAHWLCTTDLTQQKIADFADIQRQSLQRVLAPLLALGAKPLPPKENATPVTRFSVPTRLKKELPGITTDEIAYAKRHLYNKKLTAQRNNQSFDQETYCDELIALIQQYHAKGDRFLNPSPTYTVFKNTPREQTGTVPELLKAAFPHLTPDSAEYKRLYRWVFNKAKRAEMSVAIEAVIREG